jgi:hypothetical protein
MLKKSASQVARWEPTPVRIRTTAVEKMTTRIVHVPAAAGNCKGHPVALSGWHCKEETLTSNHQNKSSKLEILTIKSNVSSKIEWMERGGEGILLQ